ncbi:MAG: carboxymethylenebutenolidase [Acidobacteriota bacterium]|jgi:carboxymethylenebutenolidase|nr:carboxymethylenebutenolidase [Acidobacteriota bacterium]
MTDKKDSQAEEMTRRYFLCGAAAAVAGISVFGSNALDRNQSNEARAIDNPSITHGRVEFKSGDHMVDGYLARPKKKGRYPAVIVLPGNWITEPYIPETTALLAEGGFVGMVINTFYLFPKRATFEESRQIPWEETQKILREQITDELIYRDTQAGVEFLKSQPFVKKGKQGVMGFCFGGRNALLFAARSRDIGAVAPFYGPVIALPGVSREERPKQPLDADVVKQIRVPVQGHYGTKDKNIGLAEIKQFEQALRAQGTPVEIYTYEAEHGFFAYNRPTYRPDDARLARERMLAFFKKHLK